jgi:hypothetical protein
MSAHGDRSLVSGRYRGPLAVTSRRQGLAHRRRGSLGR